MRVWLFEHGSDDADSSAGIVVIGDLAFIYDWHGDGVSRPAKTEDT
jgi:hypothetical protein